MQALHASRMATYQANWFYHHFKATINTDSTIIRISLCHVQLVFNVKFISDTLSTFFGVTCIVFHLRLSLTESIKY